MLRFEWLRRSGFNFEILLIGRDKVRGRGLFYEFWKAEKSLRI
jgi:hypothetical protein